MDNEPGNSYVEMVNKKREEHMNFFNSSKIYEVRQELLNISNELKRKTEVKGAKTLKKEKLAPIRRSQRLQNIPCKPMTSETVLSVERRSRRQKVEVAEMPTEPIHELKFVAKNKSLPANVKKTCEPLPFGDVAVQSNASLTNTLVSNFRFLSDDESVERTPLSYRHYEKEFELMKASPSLAAKLVLTRIYSVAIHPSDTKILISAGSSHGEIAFWDVESKSEDEEIYLYRPHSHKVSCLEFNPECPTEVCSSSFDGTLKCGDLQKAFFREVHATNQDGNSNVSCTFFDFLSPFSFIVSHSDGTVSVVDKRTARKCGENRHQTHDCIVKSVSVHPVKKSYFTTSGSNGTASLWDLRILRKEPLTVLHHGKCVNSASFSPLTGNCILTSSMDDRLSVFDSTSMTTHLELKTSIRHDHSFLGIRWPFRAIWLPRNEEAFIVGNTHRPRSVELYEVNGTLAQRFSDENFNSVCTIFAFHVSKPVLAGGSFTGRVHVFMPR